MSTAVPSELRKTLIVRARSCIGKSAYRFSAALSDAPGVVNCYTLVQWLWREVGLSLGEHLLRDSQLVSVSLAEVDMADLLFTPKRGRTIETDDFGHVGVAIREDTVVHATWRKGVIETPMSDFLRRGILGIRRVPENLYCRL